MLNLEKMRSHCIGTLTAPLPPAKHRKSHLFYKTSVSSSLCWFSTSAVRKIKLINGNLPQHFRLSQNITCSSINQSSSDQGDTQPSDQYRKNVWFWSDWKARTQEMSGKLAKLGLAAVLAYGLFDAVTYTSFFVLAFLGYEKSTGKNPAANLQALLGIVIMMWAGNNVTRPFRVAGAAGLAPFIDRGLKKMQNYFNFPRQIYAFALVVAFVAGTCFTIVGLLVLSRWGK